MAAHLPFDQLNAVLRGAAEPTRLRILALLAEAELTVSDLTDILRQSQPRISRHLKLLSDAGLVERSREGSWAFFRLPEASAGAELARALIARLDPADPVAARDRERLTAVRAARAAAAQSYFRAHAGEWDRIAQTARRRRSRGGGDCRRAAASGRSARCSISAPAPAACSNCSGRRSSAGSASISRSPCWRSRARGSIAPACGTARCARATSTTWRCRADSFDAVLDPPGAALSRRRRRRDPRGGARAASGRAAAGRRLRAARSRVPARGACASAPRLRARGGRAMDERGRARRRLAAQPAARAGLGRQDRGLALARARSAPARSPSPPRGRWRDGLERHDRPAASPRPLRARASASRSSSSRRRPTRWSGPCGSRSRGWRRSRRPSCR